MNKNKDRKISINTKARVKKNIQKFSALSNLQKTIISLLCSFTIERPEYKKLMQVFTKLDADMDGSLSK